MGIDIGIILALGAMLFWGVGDFLIQRSSRKLGPTETLFLITAFGTLAFLPFVLGDLSRIMAWSAGEWHLLILSTVGILGSALFHFEGLRRGKMAIIEPFLSLEIPVAAFLAFVVVGETLGLLEMALVAAIIVGLFMLAVETSISRLESGAGWGFTGAIFMGAANFVVAIASRETNPWLVNWFLSMAITAITAAIITYRGAWRRAYIGTAIGWKELGAMVVADNIAWILFAFASVTTSIAIAVGISEAYLIIAVLLGIFVNKETLRRHQKWGLVLAIAAVITLAFLVG